MTPPTATADIPDTDRCDIWQRRAYLHRVRPDQPDQMPDACTCCTEPEERS